MLSLHLAMTTHHMLSLHLAMPTHHMLSLHLAMATHHMLSLHLAIATHHMLCLHLAMATHPLSHMVAMSIHLQCYLHSVINRLNLPCQLQVIKMKRWISCYVMLSCKAGIDLLQRKLPPMTSTYNTRLKFVMHYKKDRRSLFYYLDNQSSFLHDF